MINKRVLITGVGAISAAGINVAETMASFRRGLRNAGNLTLFETSLEYPVFEVKGLPEKYNLEGRRTAGLALCAVEEALIDAGLVSRELAEIRVGVCMGTTVASQLNDLDFYKSFRETGMAPLEPIDRFLKGNLADCICQNIGSEGPSLTIVNACSSGTDAMGVALSWLHSGMCDAVIAGGADELSRIPCCGFGSLGIISRDLCAPFDRDRKGLNLGEGAGVLVLESEESARRRGRKPDLALLGFGAYNDAYHLTSPHPEGVGLAAAINNALQEAGISAEDVSFVNSHGTSTIENDKIEGKVLFDIFGPALNVISTKGFTGHALGAAGGLEAAFTAMALKEGWIPASPGFLNKDDEIPLEPVKEITRIEGRYAVSTSLGFGGNNAAIVIGKGTTI